MQNSKTASATLRVKNPQKQFSKLSKDLLLNYGFDDVKPTIDNLLLGWISSDYVEYEKENRVKILDFFTKSLIHFQALQVATDNNIAIEIKDFDNVMQTTFNHDFKQVKKYFKDIHFEYFKSDFANDSETRNDVLYRLIDYKRYFKKVYKLKETLKN